MNKTTYEYILLPTLTRLGTWLAGSLLGYGIAADHANAIGLGAVALIAAGIDYATAYVARKRVERKALANGK